MKTTIPVTCQHCGKPFQIEPHRLRHGRGKHCSPKCQYESIATAPKETREWTCARCGKVFTTTGRQPRKYCSAEFAFPKPVYTCQHCGKTFRQTPSAHSKFCSVDCANRAIEKSLGARASALAEWADPETHQRLMDGIARRSNMPEWYQSPHFQKGPAHPRYKGNKRDRLTAVGRYAYKQWQMAVYARCSFTCQDCGAVGGILIAHHILPWADYPESRYEVGNGIALCPTCHDRAHGHITKTRTRVCLGCGQRFLLRKSRQHYCSLPCFHEWQKRQARSYASR